MAVHIKEQEAASLIQEACRGGRAERALPQKRGGVAGGGCEGGVGVAVEELEEGVRRGFLNENKLNVAWMTSPTERLRNWDPMNS